ncbi:lysozyme [Roseibium denhamense]|uniref:Lysozyme n=1 Tax=Roseibium denhamense TaxID=76305 RepID=A0ABY1PHY1_9HYPH|nr:GH25 family lysozyme [Roseibium denhamense]MTI04732.1 lysozyme [Roseibium denhamense]SMP33641.1 lysozyme [Roseibium denhamense]
MRFLQALLRLLFYVAVGCVIAIGGAAYFFMTWEPDRDDFPIRGIDVSHHQGLIEWDQVAGDDVAFAYIKASEGGDFKDSAFERNWSSAGSAGLARGAYHFFSLCKDGVSQARNFIDQLPDDADMLAPAVDLEFEGNCPRRPAVAEVLQEISQFTALVEQATGKRVVFYAPEDFYAQYLKGQGLNRRLWVRSIWHSPVYTDQWVLWQYHQRGTVKGITGDVDLNVLEGELSIVDLKS